MGSNADADTRCMGLALLWVNEVAAFVFVQQDCRYDALLSNEHGFGLTRRQSRISQSRKTTKLHE